MWSALAYDAISGSPMKKKEAQPPVVEAGDKPFDDVMRQLLRAKPQHKHAAKKAPAKKTAKR